MLIFFLIGAAAIVWIWQQVYSRNWIKGLSGELDFLEEYVYAGERAHIRERIENHKRMPIPVLELSFQIRRGVLFHDMENAVVSDFLYKRDVFSLLGFQRINRELEIDCPKRGCYPVKKLELRTYSLLYRRKYMAEQINDAELQVYAKRVDVSDILLVCERMMGVLQCAKRLYEDPFAFHAIREYTPTDPMRTINWKASAKTGELMVNTFDSTLTQKVMLYLDIEDKGIMKKDSLIEESISVAASLAQKLIGQGMEVGLAVNTASEIYLEPQAHRGQLRRIEQTLCRVSSEEGTSDYGGILSNLPEEAMPIFITRDGARNQAKIEEFLGRDMCGLWVCPQEKQEHISVETSGQLICIIREVAE